MPYTDLVVYGVRNKRSVLVQVRAFTGKNKCPFIGVSARFDEIDDILEEKIFQPFVFIQVAEELTCFN